MLFILGNATSDVPNTKSTIQMSVWHNYEKNYSEDFGCDNDVIDTLVSN